MKSSTVFLLFLILVGAGFAGEAKAGNQKLIPADDAISDSEARLQLARLAAWDGRYDEALASYDVILKQSPGDIVALREKARTASWAKLMDLSLSAYDAILEIPAEGPGAESLMQTQRAVKAEREAKRLWSEKRLLGAYEACEEAIRLEPRNQEMLFDTAQSAYALGLPDRALEAYERLLATDPFHRQAAEAAKMLRKRRKPALVAGYGFFDEEGRDGLADMRSQLFSLGAEIPFSGRQTATLAARRRLYEPAHGDGSFDAYGASASLRGTFSERLSASAQAVFEDHDDDAVSSTLTGGAALDLRPDDRFTVRPAYERRNEYPNRFAMLQEIQSDALCLGISSRISRRVEAGIEGRAISYDDDNDGWLLAANLGLGITDHPKELKLALRSELRDTGSESMIQRNGPTVTDIIHPYWTPQDYSSGSAALIWRHDMSPRFYMGGDLRFYELSISGGSGSDDNPFLRGEATWRNECRGKWIFGAGASIHESRDYDSFGILAEVVRRI